MSYPRRIIRVADYIGGSCSEIGIAYAARLEYFEDLKLGFVTGMIVSDIYVSDRPLRLDGCGGLPL